MARLGRPLPPPYLDPLLDLLRHLLSTDPERFVVALSRVRGVDPGGSPDQIVGFGIALQRDHVWFLSQLYVLPQEQGRGIGRALLTRILPSLPPLGAQDTAADLRPGVLATCTDSAQPVSNGMYARFGIVPRLPVFNLVGTARPSILPTLPDGIDVTPFAEVERQGHGAPGSESGPAWLADTIAAIDRDALGYAHPEDHAYLRANGRSGFLYRTSDGRPIGYGYHSEAGRFGPVALLDETLIAPVIGHLLTTIQARGATTVWVPGANDRAMVAFLRAGLRIEGFPAQLCWTRPFAAFDRYLPGSLALL